MLLRVGLMPLSRARRCEGGAVVAQHRIGRCCASLHAPSARTSSGPGRAGGPAAAARQFDVLTAHLRIISRESRSAELWHGLQVRYCLRIDALGLTTVDLLGHSMGGEVAQMIALDRPDLARRLILVGTGPRGGDGMDELPADVAALFTKRDELGEDMWLPIMFSPSKQSRAAGRAFIERITARTEDRDVPVSDRDHRLPRRSCP